jgi:hypothetical protein
MTGFWIAGITINLVFLGAIAWWAVRSWRQGRPGERRGEDDAR